MNNTLWPETDGQGARRFVSPRARKAARERGVDLDAVTGSGPHGRIVERDVLAAAGRAGEVGGAGRGLASPVARRVAAELGVDLATLRGSGPGGRIVEADVYRATAGAVAGIAPPAAPPVPTPVPETAAEVAPLSAMRRVVAARMAESARHVARVTLFMDVDATEMVRLRRQLATEFERAGVRLSYDALVARACARALGDFPDMNTEWIEGQGLRRHAGIHVGVAVALEPEGLVVPVLRDAAGKGFSALARELHELIGKAQSGRLQPDEMSGGTFTITNLGGVGVRAFTPIVNPPQTGILGVGAIREVPALVEGRWEPRSDLTLSLSFDHRVVDGLPAARFLARVRELLERPYTLIMDI